MSTFDPWPSHTYPTGKVHPNTVLTVILEVVTGSFGTTQLTKDDAGPFPHSTQPNIECLALIKTGLEAVDTGGQHLKLAVTVQPTNGGCTAVTVRTYLVSPPAGPRERSTQLIRPDEAANLIAELNGRIVARLPEVGTSSIPLG